MSDVFALSSVPRLVVLSGCETGRSDGLGLAHAFVAAGARAVVGITRVVPDAGARAAMQVFYANLPANKPSAEAATIALQAMTRTLLRDGRAGAAWKSFRVFVP